MYRSVVSIETMPVLQQQSKVSFRELGIVSAQLLDNIKGLGIKTPTEVLYAPPPLEEFCVCKDWCAHFGGTDEEFIKQARRTGNIIPFCPVTELA